METVLSAQLFCRHKIVFKNILITRKLGKNLLCTKSECLIGHELVKD